MVGGGELAGGDRHGRRLLAGVGRDRHDPDLGRAIAVDVAEARDAVGAIDRFGDDAHVGFSWLVGCRLLRRRQIGGTRGRREGDRLAVGCPLGVARAARDVGDGPRLAPDIAAWAARAMTWICAGCGRPSFSTERTKCQPAAVGRPARAGVAGAARDRARRLAAVSLREPDGRVVGILLLVDGHAHEGHLRAVGRDLRIGDPHEREEILVRDRPALGVRGRDEAKQRWPERWCSERYDGSLPVPISS